MINISDAGIRQLAVHFVGNKSLDEGIELSESVLSNRIIKRETSRYLT